MNQAATTATNNGVCGKRKNKKEKSNKIEKTV
jgi:hypothetical protein